MRNLRAQGDVLDYLIPQAGSPAADQTIESGDVVKIGDLVGVAKTTGSTGDTIAVAIEGAFEVPKKTGTAWGQGDKLYFDHVNNEHTKSADDGGSPLVTFAHSGWAYHGAASGDALGTVALKH